MNAVSSASMLADPSARLEAAGLPYDGDVPGMSADLLDIPPAVALVALCLREARDAGYRIGALQSSDMGYHVYERLGFRHVCTYRHHVHPAPLPENALSA